MERSTLGLRAAVAAISAFSCCYPTIILAQAPRAAEPRAVQIAQNQPGPRRVARNLAAEGRDDDLAADGVFLPPDRASKRRLEMASQMLDEGRPGEAVRLLGSVLENAEDYFFKPSADSPVFRSLKAEAGRMIGGLAREGRESYELQFGGRARQMLKQASASGSVTGLADVARQFFFTKAGAEATYLLARHHLDQNRPLAAAMCFERLYASKSAADALEPALSLSLATCWVRAGRSEKAKEALVRLKKNYPRGEVIIGGKQVKLFSGDGRALAWLGDTVGHQQASERTAVEGWAMFRGDESRNATSDGGRPLLNLRWRQRTADDRTVERFVTKLRQDYLNQEMVSLPSFHPLAVGDVVLMRTAFATQAVDFATGKLVWKYPSNDESFENVVKTVSTPPSGQSAQLFSALAQRMWEDAIYGTMSSDGESVYYVDELGLGLAASPGNTILHNGRRVAANSAPRTTNQLAARELRTQGKLKWQVGGPTGEDEPKLAGAFFLGPPLPLSGQLYVLAEMKGQEVRLVVLSPDTGALVWSQQLAVVDKPVFEDSFRRNAGATPSFGDGVLVCPTSAGAIVGLDLTTRSLLWGYQYPRSQSVTDRFNAARFAIYPGNDRQAGDHWIDGSITIADGRVLVTPVESEQMYCLNLVDGKELWKQDRGGNLFVACVRRGRAIMVGRNSVSALDLSDGEKTWDDLELPGGAMPSGRGFATADDYYLPLTTAEVIKINMQTGKIEQRASSHSGRIPGNLVCHRDSILSQGVDGLEVYYQFDALKKGVTRTLADHPDDPAALASLAEVKIDEGSLGEGIELLRRSYSIKQDPSTRERLVESLLEGLRIDFAAHRSALAELENLIERDEHRLAYLRLVAAGLQSAGEVQAAFEAYLKLADQAEPQTLDAIDRTVSVRRDRWIGAQLEQLRAAATHEQQEQMDAVISARVHAALAGDSPTALRAVLATFGSHPAAHEVRRSLAARLDAADILEFEMLIRALDATSSPQQLAPLVARLARMLEQAGRGDLAAIYYRQLAERFADVVAGDGKTGRQLAAELAPDSRVRTALAALEPWPLGKVSAREAAGPQVRITERRAQRLLELEVNGAGASLFKDMSLLLDPPGTLIGQDGLGEKRFRIPIGDPRGRQLASTRFNPYSAPPLTHVSVTGGLLIMSVGSQVVAIDGLRGSDQASNRVLWVADLGESVGGFPGGQSIYSRPVPLAWGGTRHVAEDALGRRYGALGPLSDHAVYFQRLRDLHCVHPLTGKSVWVRKNVGIGNQLFGDEELLLVAPAGEGDTLVLRSATGELAGKRRIVPYEKRMATIGRRVLCWEPQGAKVLLQMRDPWQDEVNWSHTFAPGAKAALAGQDAVAVLQPDGQFSLVTLADGKMLVNERLEPENTLTSIHLLRSDSQYLLVTNSVARNEPNVSVQPLPNAGNNPFINGRVYAFAADSGRKLWPAPAVVSQYSMLPAQPSHLPVLVFVRQVSRPAPPPRTPNQTSILCIDKRTGQVVYENDQLPPPSITPVELVGDAIAHTVTLTIGQKLIELKFTNEPPAAAGAASVKAALGEHLAATAPIAAVITKPLGLFHPAE